MLNKRHYRTLNSYISEKDVDRKKIQIDILDKFLSTKNGEITQLIMFWGAGYKNQTSKEDLQALLFLYGTLKVLERTYQTECELTFLFTDTHAYLNGYDMKNVQSYYHDLRHYINVANYYHFLMSELIQPHIKNYGVKSPFELIDKIIELSNDNGIEEINYIKQQDGFEILRKSAKKNSKRLTDPESAQVRFKSDESSAIAYAKLNLIEKPIIERRFPNSIFITYVSEEEDFILPEMPILRLFSIQKGFRSRPWFIYNQKKNT